MAVQDMTPADLAAVMKDNNGFGDNGWWILLLFFILGNNGFGWGGNAAASGDVLYPWLNQSQTLLDGFANVTSAVTNGFANAETAATNRQMADMQQNFNLSQQLSNCCCENRLATANLGSDIAREACANRQTVSDGIRDVLTAISSGFQMMTDQRYQDKIDAKNDEIAMLRQQISMQDLAASQIAQTATLRADIAAAISTLKPATTVTTAAAGA